MLTDYERRVMEVLEVFEAHRHPIAQDNAFLYGVADADIVPSLLDRGLVVDPRGFDTYELTPAGRAELNRLRAKANESEVGDE